MKSASTDAARHRALTWLTGRINYERNAVIPYQKRQLKLDRMRQLLTRLGSPDAGMRIVHIAGTKGKGSVAKMTAAMLTSAGYRTGVYSSPHLERIEERFAVDGQPCSAGELIALVNRIRPVVERMDAECGDPTEGPTFFDITTALGLLYFADRQADAVVLEVGLGGRLDSTNVCLPVITAITSISRDHTKQLGETLAEIAGEKAGIAKPGVPMVSGVTQPNPRAVVAAAAREHGCRLIEIGRDFGFSRNAQLVDYWLAHGSEREQLRRVTLGARGVHQAHNAAVALAIATELANQGWRLPEAARREALQQLRLPGRVEVFPGTPTVVIDTAHNEASAQALAGALAELGDFGRRTLVLAASRDKDVRAIVGRLAPCFDRVIATRYLENPRAVAPDDLADLVGEYQAAEVVRDPREAFDAALRDAGEDDLVCVAGSFFIAAELRPVIVGVQPSGF